MLFTIVAFLLFVIGTLTMRSMKSAKKEISEVRPFCVKDSNLRKKLGFLCQLLEAHSRLPLMGEVECLMSDVHFNTLTRGSNPNSGVLK